MTKLLGANRGEEGKEEFGGIEEDEKNVGESKLRTSRNNRKKKNWICFGLVGLLMIVLAVGLGVGISSSKKKGKENDDYESDGQTTFEPAFPTLTSSFDSTTPSSSIEYTIPTSETVEGTTYWDETTAFPMTSSSEGGGDWNAEESTPLSEALLPTLVTEGIQGISPTSAVIVEGGGGGTDNSWVRGSEETLVTIPTSVWQARS